MKLRLWNIYHTFKYDILADYAMHMRKAATPSNQVPTSDITTSTGVYKSLMQPTDLETAQAIGALATRYTANAIVGTPTKFIGDAWGQVSELLTPFAPPRRRTGWEQFYDRFTSKNVKMLGFTLLNVLFVGILYNSWANGEPATTPAT